MKKVFIKIFLLFGFSVLFCSILYSAEDNNKSQLQSSQVSDEKSSQTSEQTPPKSILPPVVPINIPALPKLPKLPTLPPSTSVTKSVPSVPILPQKIQLIKGLLGTVVNIGSKKDEILWLDVKDRFSDETVRINVNSKKTRVIQKDAALVLKDIKTGDIVRIIFNQAGKEIPVNVISIINEEDLKINAQPK